MQTCTSTILSICDDIFNPESCHQLACSSRFNQRSSSKINGHEFVKALVLPSQGLSEDSLNGLCERMREFNPQADISASALAQRINTEAAVRFMRSCFEKTLKLACEKMEKQYSSLEGALQSFNNVYIQDSTVIEISKWLAGVFPGTKRGGKKYRLACTAQMKIDLIHNFTTGQITDAQIYEGKRPDQALSGKIAIVIKKGDLVLRDLGYFKIETLKTIDEIGAYFLSRFPPHVKVYLNRDDEKPVDLATHLNKYYSYQSAIELNVWISDERLPVRLVAYRVPKDVVAERKRKAKKRAKEMKRTLSKEKLAQMEFSLFVTNIPAKMLSLDVIGTVYRLRWEIELLFKTWKSCLKIDVLKGVCEERIKCLIWSRLCMAILVAYISAKFLNLAKRLCEGELSPVKLIRYLLRNGTLCRAVATQTLVKLEQIMVKDMPRRFMKDKRGRTTMREKVIALETYYESDDYVQLFDSRLFMLA